MTTFVQAVGGTHQKKFVINAWIGAEEKHPSCAFRKMIKRKNWRTKLARNGRLENKNVIKVSVALKVYVMMPVDTSMARNINNTNPELIEKVVLYIYPT